MGAWWWVAVLVLLPLLLQYVAGPLLVKENIRHPRHPEFTPLEQDRVPPSIWQYFERVSPSLAGLGFEPKGDFLMPGASAQVSMFLRVFRHERLEVGAVAVGALVKQKEEERIHATYVEFSVRFRDGQIFGVSNSRELPSFAPLPHRHNWQFPDVTDLVDLWRIFRAILAQAGKSGAGLPPEGAEVSRWLAQGVSRECIEQVDVGYLAHSDDGNAFVPTWKGAALMTWKACWPVSSFRRARRQSHNQQLLLALAPRLKAAEGTPLSG